MEGATDWWIGSPFLKNLGIFFFHIHDCLREDNGLFAIGEQIRMWWITFHDELPEFDSAYRSTQ